MDDVNVEKLAELARLHVSGEELEALKRDVPSIIALCAQVQEVGGEPTKDTGEHYNILREDDNPHEAGMYTKELLEAMPAQKDDMLQVRKIISQD